MKACKYARFISFVQILKVDIYFLHENFTFIFIFAMNAVDWTRSHQKLLATQPSAQRRLFMLPSLNQCHWRPQEHLYCSWCSPSDRLHIINQPTSEPQSFLHTVDKHSTELFCQALYRHGTEPFCALQTNIAKAFLCIINIAVTFLCVLNTALNLSVHYEQM